MSVYWVRTVEAAPADVPAAREWAKKLSEYLNNVYPEAKGEVLKNLSGNPRRIHFVVKYESLAQMEELEKKVEADEKYQALLRERREAGLYFVSASDQLYQVL